MRPAGHRVGIPLPVLAFHRAARLGCLRRRIVGRVVLAAVGILRVAAIGSAGVSSTPPAARCDSAKASWSRRQPCAPYKQRGRTGGSSLVQLAARASLVKREHVERVADGDQHVLAAVDREGLRRVRGAADARVPQRLAGLGVDARRSCRRASPAKSRPPASSAGRRPPPPPRRDTACRHAALPVFGSIAVRQLPTEPSCATALPPRPIEPRGSGIGQVEHVEAVVLVARRRGRCPASRQAAASW